LVNYYYPYPDKPEIINYKHRIQGELIDDR